MHATIPKGIVGDFEFTFFQKKYQRMAREAMDVCLRVLKESNKSRFDSYSVRKSALIISHITFRDCRVHSSSDNLSRNSCMWTEIRPIGYRFRPGAKATRYRVNMAFNSSIWVAVTNSFVGGDVRLTELSVNLFTPKESKVKSTIFHFVKYWMKQIVLRKSAVKEPSFKWSHLEILSTDSKVRTTRLHYSLWVKALKQSWLAI